MNNFTKALAKLPSGIRGLDEITGGGLPKGRASLVCGGAGSGKTLFALTYLVEGALKYGEPGVFMCFEENEEELAANIASLGYDLDSLIASKKLSVDYVHVERSEIEETGEYDLEGLFVRLDYAIKSVGAKRVGLDTLEALFGGLSNAGVLRAELRRLFRWLKDQGVTSIITAERGEGALTRHGLEEYVSDCVIMLDQRVAEQVATRRLRVVKYRGAAHGTNEYPFLIDSDGISVLPVTSIELAHEVSKERISTGVAGLDEMLGGKGFWRGSSILVSGMAGTGKSTMAAHFVDGACRRGEKAVYFAFEESPHQIVRNMRSVGLDLQQWVDAGLLRFSASRPTFWGLEMHLARMHKEVEQFNPAVVVVDPIYNLSAVGSANEVRLMLLRLIDHLKSRQVSAMFTAIDADNLKDVEHAGVSSLMDSWLLVQTIEGNGERNRGLYVIKARGIAHSNQIREFLLSDQGVQLRDVYLGEGEVLTGSARAAQEARENEMEVERQLALAAKQREAERKRSVIEAQIAALQAELEAQSKEAELFAARQRASSGAAVMARKEIASMRGRGK
ncbi:MAG: circadian clock protein KaiC [Rhodoblastus sp.]|uniref:circadian clock protein KaiC n=1 Tax=Rhodoblastus sp. TaxID=1962975 RepID=UPI003F952C4C